MVTIEELARRFSMSDDLIAEAEHSEYVSPRAFYENTTNVVFLALLAQSAGIDKDLLFDALVVTLEVGTYDDPTTYAKAKADAFRDVIHWDAVEAALGDLLKETPEFLEARAAYKHWKENIGY
jgi:hypothetical protein